MQMLVISPSSDVDTELIHSHRNIRNQSNVNYQFYFLCCFRFDSMRLRQLNMNDAPLIIWVSDDVPV